MASSSNLAVIHLHSPYATYLSTLDQCYKGMIRTYYSLSCALQGGGKTAKEALRKPTEEGDALF